MPPRSSGSVRAPRRARKRESATRARPTRSRTIAIAVDVVRRPTTACAPTTASRGTPYANRICVTRRVTTRGARVTASPAAIGIATAPVRSARRVALGMIRRPPRSRASSAQRAPIIATRSTELATGTTPSPSSVVKTAPRAQARQTIMTASPTIIAAAGSRRRTTPTDQRAVDVESSATATPAAIAAGTASCPRVDMTSESTLGPKSIPLGALSAAARPVATANASPTPARMTANSHQAKRRRRRRRVNATMPRLTATVVTRPADSSPPVSNAPTKSRTRTVRLVTAAASHHVTWSAAACSSAIASTTRKRRTQRMGRGNDRVSIPTVTESSSDSRSHPENTIPSTASA